MLDERRKDKDAAKKHQDFFQLLINVVDELNQDETESKEDSDIIHEEIVKSKKKGLSKIEDLPIEIDSRGMAQPVETLYVRAERILYD
uniref:Uncharacterized protein n=1 Tax=Acrobeloides nanus TaxID=290746 RepID=A0A914CY49_9BILA